MLDFKYDFVASMMYIHKWALSNFSPHVFFQISMSVRITRASLRWTVSTPQGVSLVCLKVVGDINSLRPNDAYMRR